MGLVKHIQLNPIGDKRGQLISLEENKTVPFSIKRVYYLLNTKEGMARGFHAHKNLKQVAVCVRGSCRFILDNGKSRQSVVLNDASKGILIEELIWREIHDFTPDSILLVLASEHYDESDYIRNYQKFMEFTNG